MAAKESECEESKFTMLQVLSVVEWHVRARSVCFLLILFTLLGADLTVRLLSTLPLTLIFVHNCAPEEK